MTRYIDRAEWNTLTTAGEPVAVAVSVRAERVALESDDGMVSVDVYAREDGIDVRIQNVELVVKLNHIVLMQRVTPYPIRQWAVLWEGDMA